MRKIAIIFIIAEAAFWAAQDGRNALALHVEPPGELGAPETAQNANDNSAKSATTAYVPRGGGAGGQGFPDGVGGFFIYEEY